MSEEVEKVDFKELDAIALGFAQALITQGSELRGEELSKEAMELACQWRKGQQEREMVYASHSAKWTKLGDLGSNALADFKTSAENFWFIGRSVEHKHLELFKGYFDGNSSFAGHCYECVRDDSGDRFIGVYALGANEYTLKLPPQPPKGVQLVKTVQFYNQPLSC